MSQAKENGIAGVISPHMFHCHTVDDGTINTLHGDGRAKGVKDRDVRDVNAAEGTPRSSTELNGTGRRTYFTPTDSYILTSTILIV